MASTQTTPAVSRVGTASDAFNLSFIIRSGENSSPVGISSLVLSLTLCLYTNLCLITDKRLNIKIPTPDGKVLGEFELSTEMFCQCRRDESCIFVDLC